MTAEILSSTLRSELRSKRNFFGCRLCKERSNDAIQFLHLRLDRVTAFAMTNVCRSVFVRNETA